MWLQGYGNAPDICKACLASLRRYYPEKDIVVLDNRNVSQYVTLTDYIIRKHERGMIGSAHYSDLVRLVLLTELGGTWIDSTMLCTGRKYAEYLELPFFYPMWHEGDPSSILTSLIVSAPCNPVLMLTRDLLFR